MRQRIDISEVEAATKIRAKYLRALENEEWDLLPGPDVRQELPAHLRASTSGSTAGCSSRSTSCATSASSDIELQPIAPRPRCATGARAAARARGAGVPRSAGRRARRRRLLVARAPRRGDDERGTSAVDGADGHADDRGGRRAARRTAAERRRRQPAARRRPRASCALQVVPTGPVFVCLVDARGRQLVDGLDAAARRRHADVPLGALPPQPRQQQVRLRVNGKRLRTVPPSSSADRLRDHAAARPHARCPPAQRPTCG